ncbi:hypothetical protein [Nocardioides sp. B-3]|uniref:hypothetical protein n=1 Tax=Nocardioides sp. B-3 TaxID=2895565 RepID=UPI0021526355|nr:hypothetical protein [Nocardioides sp. B-3]UUZ60846.1 hypothetical protein LP418_08970 [Nocardioides sp. B-3]
MTQNRRSLLLTCPALMTISASAVLGVTLVAMLFVGWFAPAIPIITVAVVHLYRLTIRSSSSYEGRVVAREVGAGAPAIAAGPGTRISVFVVGLWAEILPPGLGTRGASDVRDLPVRRRVDGRRSRRGAPGRAGDPGGSCVAP